MDTFIMALAWLDRSKELEDEDDDEEIVGDFGISYSEEE